MQYIRTLTIVLAAAAVLADAGQAATAALPSTSKASADVLGIKLGVSTVDEVRTVLGSQVPRLLLKEEEAQLVGQSKAGRAYAQNVPIPNGKYVASIRATPEAFRDFPEPGPADLAFVGKGDYSSLTVVFSTPPDGGTALAVNRTIRFAASPSLEATERSLIEKYGTPGYRKSYGDRGAQWDFVWAWDAGGNPLPLNELHACVNQQLAFTTNVLSRSDENAQTALNAGCAVVLHAILGVSNGAVKSLQVLAADQFHVHATSARTAELVTRGVADSEEEERDKSSKVPTPKL